jgi:hypothetical protein
MRLQGFFFVIDRQNSRLRRIESQKPRYSLCTRFQLAENRRTCVIIRRYIFTGGLAILIIGFFFVIGMLLKSDFLWQIAVGAIPA